MKVEILPSNLAAEKVVASILSLLEKNPSLCLGLATGSTPLEVYAGLVKAHQEGVSFASISTWNLDEYVGLAPTHPQSYRFFMNEHLFDHIDIRKENTHVPCGIGSAEANASYYERSLVEAQEIDLQILGIGSDGHIAFNEPGTPFESLTHVAELAKSTIEDNARFFSSMEQVPTKAITMGLATIMRAKKIVLLAFGKNKAEAIYGLLKGPISPVCPASILRNHPDVTVYVDEEAYSLCR